jgi:hypothetical protein
MLGAPMNDINLDDLRTDPDWDNMKPTKWWHTVAAAAVVTVATVALFGLAENEEPAVVAPGSTYDTNQGVEYLEFAGTVRNDGTGWAPLNNSGHADDDLLSVTNVTATSIRVNHPLCAQVVSVIVGADNEYAQDFGAKFGPSAGFGYFVIEGSVNDSSDSGTADDVWNPLEDFTAGTNIWILGKCLPA